MIELTMLLPLKSSRTRIQAIRVPITALTTTMTSEESTVSLIAAHASGSLIASQNAAGPSSKDRLTTAASGISTMMLIHVRETPRMSASPPKGDRKPSLGGVATAVSADDTDVGPLSYSVGFPSSR